MNQLHLPETHQFLYLLLVLALCSGLIALHSILITLLEVNRKPTLLTYGKLLSSTIVIMGQIIVGGMALAVLLNS